MQPGERPDDEQLSEDERVRLNIRHQYLELYDRDGRYLTVTQANQLIDHDVDWHAFKELLDQGCPIKTARRILL